MDDNVPKDKPLVADYHSEGKIYKFRYYELANYDKLDLSKVEQIYGVCFYQNQMVIVLNGKKRTWGLVGGKLEKGESIQQALEREVQEESNMQLLKWRPIGVQEVTDPNGSVYNQLRVACKVKPLDEFTVGTITEVKLIDPKDYKNYFDWGEIGEQIIHRANQLRPKL